MFNVPAGGPTQASTNPSSASADSSLFDSKSAAPKQKMDLNKLMRLMDMKKTYQVSKSLMRVFFSLLCGFVFHVAFFIYNVKFANVALFAICLIAFYKLLDYQEEVQFNRPIQVRQQKNMLDLVHFLFPYRVPWALFFH